MKQITSNVWVETETRGCNFGFVTTTDGIVMIDSPHKPTTAIWLKSEIEKRGLLRYIINTEPHGDHWTGNAFFDAPVVAHEGVRERILNTNMEEHVMRVGAFGQEEPKLLEGYTANAPIITFKNGMTLVFALAAAAYLGVGSVWALGLSSSAALIMAAPSSLPDEPLKQETVEVDAGETEELSWTADGEVGEWTIELESEDFEFSYELEWVLDYRFTAE